MRELGIYFNELSIVNSTEASFRSSWIETLFNAFKSLLPLMIQRSGYLKFPPSALESQIDNCTLRQHIKNKLTKDEFRLFLARIRQINTDDFPEDIEIWVNDIRTIGATLAEAQKSWCFSLATSSVWEKNQFLGQKYHATDDTEDCFIRNLSEELHIESWMQEILDWGFLIAPSSVIGEVAGHRVVMYSAPKEHNPAHVHLLDHHGNDLAKFQIENFCREKGLPTWDKEMKAWIEEHRKQLLCSWERCQRGLHPYQIEPA